MSNPLLYISVYVGGIVLYFMWFSYKLGCLSRSEDDYWKKRRFANDYGSPFVMFWPFILVYFILAAPFKGVVWLGKKKGCNL